MKIKKVYFLQHFYENYDEIECITDLGVYSTRKKAEEALEKFKKNKKFKDHPNDFNIDTYEVDKTFWEEGFFSWR